MNVVLSLPVRSCKAHNTNNTLLKLFFVLEQSRSCDIQLLPELLSTKTADASIQVFVKGSVDETGQRFAIQDVVELMKPELEVTVRLLYMTTFLEFVRTAIYSAISRSGL